MKSPRFILTLLLAAVASLLGSCASQKPSGRYHYVHQEGKTAKLQTNGLAASPAKAPSVVKQAIAAGNALQNKPYRRGGGHRKINDTAYDCPGTTSFVLNKAGLLRGSMPSNGFKKYGSKGEGKWISVYAKDGHVFLVIAGLRLDTGGSNARTGPRWKPTPRNTKGFVVRHPPGL